MVLTNVRSGQFMQYHLQGTDGYMKGCEKSTHLGLISAQSFVLFPVLSPFPLPVSGNISHVLIGHDVLVKHLPWSVQVTHWLCRKSKPTGRPQGKS